MPKMYGSISPADVKGRKFVDVTITPELPQDRMVRAQLAQAFRTPGADGLPLLDDRSILTDIIEVEAPDDIQRRVANQMLAARSPEIQKLLIAAQEQAWIEDNETMMKLAEKRMNPDNMPTLNGDQMQKIIGLMRKHEQAKQMGQPGLESLLQAGGPLPSGSPTPAPGGPPPQVMPSQMMMGGPPEQPPLDMLVASQQRRGKPQNGGNY